MTDDYSLFQNDPKHIDFNYFHELTKKYEEDKKKEAEYEKAQLNSPNPKIRISKKIDKMFNDFEKTVNSKNHKMKYYIDEQIFGPSGASRIIEFDPVHVKENVIRMFNRFEKSLEAEMEKIRNAKKDILDDLDSQIKIDQ